MAKAKAKAKPEGEKPKNKGGRPSLLTDAVLQSIGERLGAGEPLTRICADIGISDRTVRDWQANDPEVAAAIARAREEGEQAIAFRVRRVAQGEKAADGEAPLSSGDVQRDRLIVETDLKLLAKFNPKKWGDKLQHSNDPDNPLQPPTVNVTFTRPD